MKKGKIILYLLAGVILIQFIGIDKSAPALEGNLDFIEVETPPDSLVTWIKNACYDCHSYETKYPSYSNIAPVSWIIGEHVQSGRRYLNFSLWDNYTHEIKRDLLYKSYLQIGKRLMPPFSYIMIHKELKLNNEQIKPYYTWFKEQANKYTEKLNHK